MHIVQPRREHYDKFVMSADSLRAWGANVVKPRAKLAQKRDAPRIPGSHCDFCRVAKAPPPHGPCRALTEKVLRTVADGFDIIATDGKPPANEVGVLYKDLTSLTHAEIANVLDNLDMIEACTGGVRGAALDALQAGQLIPNYKLVRGRSNRAWDKAVEQATIDRAMARDLRKKGKDAKARFEPLALISPPKYEKLIGKDSRVMDKYVVKPDGALTIAPVGDKRPAVIVDVAGDGFDSTAIGQDGENEAVKGAQKGTLSAGAGSQLQNLERTEPWPSEDDIFN
jgi:hypothetical protein